MSGSRPRRPRRGERASQAAAGTRTHISALPDDIMVQILLRLPSVATLVRAACACRAWRRAVASCPDFRRRFRALRPAPPLLGLFFDINPRCPDPCVPTFAPVRLGDRDLAAAVRGGDFFLTSLPDRPDTYCISECRGGHILLWSFAEDEEGSQSHDKMFIVFNPLMRRQDVSPIVHEDPFRHDPQVDVHPARLVCSEDDPSSFRLVHLALREDDEDDPMVCASVFSSETAEWSLLPWVNVPEDLVDDDYYSLLTIVYESRMQANGFLYWVLYDQMRLIALDTVTMEFSFPELPVCLSHDCTYDAGETKDGKTCIVFSDQSNIGVLMLRREDDGVERWVLDRVVSMDTELKRVMRDDLGEDDSSEVFIFAVRDGYAYLSTTPMYNNPTMICWFMSLCLETMRLEKLFQRTCDSEPYPYIMSWPRFLLEGAE